MSRVFTTKSWDTKPEEAIIKFINEFNRNFYEASIKGEEVVLEGPVEISREKDFAKDADIFTIEVKFRRQGKIGIGYGHTKPGHTMPITPPSPVHGLIGHGFFGHGAEVGSYARVEDPYSLGRWGPVTRLTCETMEELFAGKKEPEEDKKPEPEPKEDEVSWI